MIKKLQTRMILLVLCGLLLASAGLVAAVNLINWNSLRQQAAGILDMLAENGGQRPLALERQRMNGWEDGLPEKPNGEDREPPEGFTPSPDDAGQIRGRGALDLRNVASLSSYYTILLNADGEIASWSSDRAELYEEDDIQELTADILKRGAASGRVSSQFYRIIDQADGSRLLIVVDQRLAVQDADRVLRLTILLALAEDLLLSLGAIWLIRRMVKPVDEAMEKQKQFVWDASHELKTPLAVISANAEALAGEVRDSKPLEYIQSEVQRTDHLLQSLLTLARMEKGTVKAEHRRFDLSHAVLSVALPFESAVFEAGKTLRTQIPDGISCTGDEERIKQLCVILLSNAQKYSDEHGTITLTVEAKGDRRILKVHNTGTPIPKEAQSKIFDRFYRVDSSHNREIPGNGLGLAIAQSIVQEHKGKITVSSAEGEGTTFTVTL